MADDRMDAEGDLMSKEPIRGICADMCPAKERETRERTAALDLFERVDGDRNRTAVNLALKTYTRTPDRSPESIRPLPVLEHTMEYMLSLLNRPYNLAELLNLHSFLWDRMRAVRMDLRMQHLFGAEAIRMHEQTIRFHILAMHELCECPKSEGTAKGFDAHLNIDQMNKASVDLFAMYDDHRSRGEPVASESEFRGYYALLKVDQHPGFNVSPGEIASDLSKMPPYMRKSSEVTFAREVAKATRTQNHVAFFRLARKATYLQACLMHAHFIKVRAEALAVLGSALGPKQVLSLEDISIALAMEGENVEEFVVQQGIKVVFSPEDGAHIVKERGISGEVQERLPRLSRLVTMKRSRLVRTDVENKESIPDKLPLPINQVLVRSNPQVRNSVSPSASTAPSKPIIRQDVRSHSPSNAPQVQAPRPLPVVFGRDGARSDGKDKSGGAGGPKAATEARGDHDEVKIQEAQRKEEEKQRLEKMVREQALAHMMKVQKEREKEKEIERQRLMEVRKQKEREEATKRREAQAAESAAIAEFLARKEKVAKETVEAARQALEKAEASHKEEADAGKLRTLFKRWRRRVLGKPPSYTAKQLAEMAERIRLHYDQKRKAMGTALDVPALVTPTLKAQNPNTLLLCWKLIVCTRVLDKTSAAQSMVSDYNTERLGRWLRSKLTSEHEQGRLDESPFVATLANSVLGTDGSDRRVGQKSKAEASRMWYVAKELGFHGTSVSDPRHVDGTSALIFVVDCGQPLTSERERLRAVINCLAPEAKVAVLILVPRTAKEERFGNSVAGEAKDEFFPLDEHRDMWDIGVELKYKQKHDRTAQRLGTLREARVSLTDREVSELIALNLAVDGLDKGRVVAHKIVPIAVTLEEACFSRNPTPTVVSSYIADTPLVDGLSFLALHASQQPALRGIEARLLVMEYVDLAVRPLAGIEPGKVEANHVIEAVNAALNNAQKDVQVTFQQCPPAWPPPEMPKDRITPELLPRSGTFFTESVIKAVDILSRCQLHRMRSSTSFETGGDRKSKSLREQAAVLRESLEVYLASLDPPAPTWVVHHEVDTLLEHGCLVTGKERDKKLVPLWVLIVKGLVSMRLIHTLHSDSQFLIYVLEGAKRRRETLAEVGFKPLYTPVSLSQQLALAKEEEEEGEKEGGSSRVSNQVSHIPLEGNPGHPISTETSRWLADSVQDSVSFRALPRRPLSFSKTKASCEARQLLDRVKSVVRSSQLEAEADPDVYAQLNAGNRRTAHEILESMRSEGLSMERESSGQQAVIEFGGGSSKDSLQGTSLTSTLSPEVHTVSRMLRHEAITPNAKLRVTDLLQGTAGLPDVVTGDSSEVQRALVFQECEVAVEREGQQIRAKRRAGNILDVVRASRKKLKAVADAVISSSRKKRESLLADPFILGKLEAEQHSV